MLTLHELTCIDILQHRSPKSQVLHLYTVLFCYDSITRLQFLEKDNPFIGGLSRL